MFRDATALMMLVLASTSAFGNEREELGSVFLHAGQNCPSLSVEAGGQILSINSNQLLYGTLLMMYGGDGRTTFALPDLRDAAPVSSNGRRLHYCIVISIEDAPSVEEAVGVPQSGIGSVLHFTAPTGLTVTSAGSDRLRFTWQDNSNNEDGFVIERLLPMTASSTSLIATVRGAGESTGSRSHTVAIRGARSNFCYQVRATRGSSRTAPSDRACASLN